LLPSSAASGGNKCSALVRSGTRADEFFVERASGVPRLLDGDGCAVPTCWNMGTSRTAVQVASTNERLIIRHLNRVDPRRALIADSNDQR